MAEEMKHEGMTRAEYEKSMGVKLGDMEKTMKEVLKTVESKQENLEHRSKEEVKQLRVQLEHAKELLEDIAKEDSMEAWEENCCRLDITWQKATQALDGLKEQLKPKA